VHLLHRADDLDSHNVLVATGHQGTPADMGDLIIAHTPLLEDGASGGWPAACDDPVPPGYSIEWLTRRPVLGGLINEYERAA
jgi:hypothetical protein